MEWQVFEGHGRRPLVEMAIGRYKAIIGRRLRARSPLVSRSTAPFSGMLGFAPEIHSPHGTISRSKDSQGQLVVVGGARSSTRRLTAKQQRPADFLHGLAKRAGHERITPRQCLDVCLSLPAWE